MTRFYVPSLVAGAMLFLTINAVRAEDKVPNHPRVNEVNKRQDKQQKRIANGVKEGQINKKQELKDEKQATKIDRQESKDEAKHGGHLTKPEQKQLNKEQDKLSNKIYKQRHEDKAIAKPATKTSKVKPAAKPETAALPK
jgi:hypothetical protein